MVNPDLKAIANTNIHRVYGSSVLRQELNPEFIKYRRLWDEQPIKMQHGTFPLFLDIEVTNICNLRCKFCATTYLGNDVSRGNIDSALVKKIVNEGSKFGLYGVKFNDRGEPLMHKDLPEMIAYAKSAGLTDIYFNTNALLLDKQMTERILNAGLQRISISFEGHITNIYEKYRIKSSYEQVVSNIKSFRKIRDSLGLETPKIRIQTVRVKEMDEENAIQDYIDFWSSTADEICVIDYKDEKHGNSKRLIDFPYKWVCPQLFQRMVVWWDGSILPCNEDDKGKLILGNVSEMTVAEAWNSEKINFLRKTHKDGNAHKINACNGCYLRDSEIKKLCKGKL